MKKLVCAFLPVLIFSATNAQPLFTYGKKVVTKDEFVKAFNKNPNIVEDRKKALKEYLNLYINFKLKVQAAYDAKLQDDPNQQFELENFKRQIAENILNEEANINKLIKEAFDRSQKDIQVAQVYVEVPSTGDTAEAFKKINAAYQALKGGKDFSQVAREYSNDAYTIESGGDLGYVTVFTLPYEFENVVYSLKAGAFSARYRSKLGYHIFKNVTDRKGIGTRRVAQILIAVPPGATQDQRSDYARTADSVYNLLQKGSSFESLVNTFSNDLNSQPSNGALPEFGIGQYNPEFERAAFALKEKGEISKPFSSAYGYHILKLLEARPVGTDVNDAVTAAWLKEKVQQDARLVHAKDLLANKHLDLIKYKPALYDKKELWKYTDSFVAGRNTDAFKTINDKTVLFSFPKQTIKAGDWARYVQAMRAMPASQLQKGYDDLMKEYVKITGEEYYKNHLEDYSDVFRQQLQEFKEANLLFGIMDKQVWTTANLDSIGLQSHYVKNQAKYRWGPSADALIITTPGKEIAAEVEQKLKADPKNWRAISEAYESKVSIDSGRHELGQLPVVDRTNFTAGIITAPVTNPTDGTYTFNYILKVYNENEPRSFEDARGMVISDYQQVLEEKWLSELKKKYGVKVNNAVFASIK